MPKDQRLERPSLVTWIWMIGYGAKRSAFHPPNHLHPFGPSHQMYLLYHLLSHSNCQRILLDFTPPLEDFESRFFQTYETQLAATGWLNCRMFT